MLSQNLPPWIPPSPTGCLLSGPGVGGAGDAQPQQVGDGVLSGGQIAASAQTGPWEQGWGTAWSVMSWQQAWVCGTNLRAGFCSPSCCRSPRLPLEGGLGLWSHHPQVHHSWLVALGWLVVRLGGGCPPTCGCGKTQVLGGRGLSQFPAGERGVWACPSPLPALHS